MNLSSINSDSCFFFCQLSHKIHKHSSKYKIPEEEFHNGAVITPLKVFLKDIF